MLIRSSDAIPPAWGRAADGCRSLTETSPTAECRQREKPSGKRAHAIPNDTQTTFFDMRTYIVIQPFETKMSHIYSRKMVCRYVVECVHGWGRLPSFPSLEDPNPEPGPNLPKISLSPAAQGQVSGGPRKSAITHPAPTRNPVRRQLYMQYGDGVPRASSLPIPSASGISVSLTASASTADAIEEGSCEADDVRTTPTHTGASLSRRPNLPRTCPNLTA